MGPEGLLERVERTLGNRSPGEVFSRIRAIVGARVLPNSETGVLAESALTKLRNFGGDPPTPRELAALEDVIRLLRPAPLSIQGELQPIPPDTEMAFPQWTSFCQKAKTYLYSIGRIDSLSPESCIGTGFLVAPRIVATNRHVVTFLSHGLDALEEGQATVAFKEEYNSLPIERPVSVRRVAAIHDTLDLALLELADDSLALDRPTLDLAKTSVAPGDRVVVIGYPMESAGGRNPLFLRALFEGRLEVKRAAPGEVLQVRGDSVYHDCSTLGGNSGSPVLSMATAEVVGVHRDGLFMYRNEALAVGGLAQFMEATL
jgi:S1-C subfamily serine protease